MLSVTEMQQAGIDGNIEAIQKHLAEGGDIDLYNPGDGRTALYYATDRTRAGGRI